MTSLLGSLTSPTTSLASTLTSTAGAGVNSILTANPLAGLYAGDAPGHNANAEAINLRAMIVASMAASANYVALNTKPLPNNLQMLKQNGFTVYPVKWLIGTKSNFFVVTWGNFSPSQYPQWTVSNSL